MLEWKPHRQFESAGFSDMARDGENHRAAGVHGTQSGKPGRALAHDGGDGSKTLRVVDGGRLAEQTKVGRERRLESRLAGLALERRAQRGVLAADVRPGAHAG